MNDEDKMVNGAMDKLLRVTPEPFSMKARPSLAAKLGQLIAEKESGLTDENRDTLQPTIDEAKADLAKIDAEMIDGEVHRMTVSDRWKLEAWMTRREQDAEEQGLNSEYKRAFLAWARFRKFAQVVLRKKGTDGKVHVWSEDDILQIDQKVAEAVAESHYDAFELTPDQFPKAEAPRSQGT